MEGRRGSSGCWFATAKSEPQKPAGVRSGQVRTFRITKLDAEKKRIDLELTD